MPHIVRMCYTSVCYHHIFLDVCLHAQSQLRQIPLFQQCKDEWKQITKVKYPWDKNEETPMLTGIPPHVTLLSELKNLSDNMVSFKSEFRVALIEELDSRNVGGDSYHAQQIMQSLEDTRKHISDVLAGNNIDRNAERNRNVRTRGNIGGRGINIRRAQSNSGPGWHVYGGAFHMLPQGWRIPLMTLLQFIMMWLTGDQENGVPPLRNVTVYHWRNHATQHRRVWSDMQFLMKHVERAAREKGVWKENSHEWTTQDTLKLYEDVDSKFKYPGTAGSRRNRFNEFSWRTIVNLVRNHKGKLVGEVQSDSDSSDEEQQQEQEEYQEV